MQRFIISCLAILIVFTITTFGEDRRVDKSNLTIMTFNAEFLWDGVKPEEGSSRVKFDWKGDAVKAGEHMQKIADVIKKSNPDIINLVEVENLTALNTFNDKYLTGLNYKAYLAKGKDSFTGQDVALLTRIDPEGNKIIYDGRKGRSANVSKSVSKNYVARIKIGNRKIAFIGLHFLSRPIDETRRINRQAQGDAIKQIALEQIAEGYSVVVWGDFNDFDVEDESLDLLDHKPISNVLANIRLLDRNTELDDLVNVARFIEKKKRYTAWYDANRNGKVDFPNDFSAIDHILMSPSLAGTILNTNIIQDHNPMEVSDHFPIVVKMKLSSGLVSIINNDKGSMGSDSTPKEKPKTKPKKKSKKDRKYFKGKRGGCYYLTKSGRKSYVDKSSCGEDSASTDSTNSNESTPEKKTKTSSSGRTYIQGKRGGCYYINSKGKKSYVSRSKCS